MNGQATAKQTSNEILLTVLSGPESGVAYKLVGQSISLGRAPENDVVLQDSKASRNHAKIEKRGDDYWIVDLESASGVFVNGQQVVESLLHPGDGIRVGVTAMSFGNPQALSLIHSAPPLPVIAPPLPHLPLTKNMNLGGAPNHPPPMANPGMPERPNYNGNKKSLMPLIIVAAMVVGALSLWKGHSTRKSGFKVKDDSAIEQQIEMTNESNEKKAQEIAKLGKDTQQYAEAQAFYMRGFREFREGNYNRAIQAFQTSLSIYPNHPLAKRYLETSRIKNNQMITEALERGEKAFQLEKYNIAKSEFRTVTLLSGDKNNKSYLLAEKRMETIELILQSNK